MSIFLQGRPIQVLTFHCFLYNKDIFLNVFWLFSLKYLGQWYEIEWLSDRYEDPDTLYEDYTQLYSRRQDGNITITTRGR